MVPREAVRRCHTTCFTRRVTPSPRAFTCWSAGRPRCTSGARSGARRSGACTSMRPAGACGRRRWHARVCARVPPRFTPPPPPHRAAALYSPPTHAQLLWRAGTALLCAPRGHSARRHTLQALGHGAQARACVGGGVRGGLGRCSSRNARAPSAALVAHRRPSHPPTHPGHTHTHAACTWPSSARTSSAWRASGALWWTLCPCWPCWRR